VKKIKAIIFDLNGVFIQSRYLSDRFRDDFGVPPAVFMPVLKKTLNKARRPNERDLFSYWQKHFRSWDVRLSKELFYSYWFKDEKPFVPMIRLGKKIQQRGIRMFILSNNFRERAAYYRNTFPFMKKLFTKIYYSWQTGYVKPDPRAYKKILRENELEPEECLYFDDSKHNVAIARKLGIRAYSFSGVKGVERVLKKISVI